MLAYILLVVFLYVFISVYRKSNIDIYDIFASAGVCIYNNIDAIDNVDVKRDDIILHRESALDDFLRGSVGFIESYMKGSWSCKDLKSLLHKLNNANLDNIRYYSIPQLFNLGVQKLFISIKGFNKKDGELVALQHYDLPKILYKKMLGETMTYSCGYFKDTDNLDHAQLNKMDLIAQKMYLTPLNKLYKNTASLIYLNLPVSELPESELPKERLKVLDIGCGWGNLDKYLVDNYYVEVTGVTISKEQYNYCIRHHNDENLNFLLCDYRDLVSDDEEKYDRIVSVGMFEHVTSSNYEEFFTICKKLLKPKALMLLHTIIGQKSHHPGGGNEFILKYIFPNSQLPSLEQIMGCTSHKFYIEDVHNFGLYYAKTLEAWLSNFRQNLYNINDTLIKKGKNPLSKQFIRMWEAYLLMSQVGFESKKISLCQIVFSQGLDHVYEAIR